MNWTAGDIPDQTGRIAVVTGSNGGLGLEVATRLAEHGATVVLGCRNGEKAERADDARELWLVSEDLIQRAGNASCAHRTTLSVVSRATKVGAA